MPDVVNKSDIIDWLARQQDIPYQAAKAVVEVFFETIVEALEHGRRVELRGFGSFKIKSYDSYRGRNPRTGEMIAVPPKQLPAFKAGKELTERVNGTDVQPDNNPPTDV